MSLLFRYLKQYKKLIVVTLVLAAVNQLFSLLDPQIFRLIIDRYLSHLGDLSQSAFVRGVLLLLAMSVGAAFVSRVAKNFQDYYVNVIMQRLGARLYADSVAHSFSLPYAVFEDQRSGYLLRVLQKARDDSQQFIRNVINILFLALIGIIFVLSYAFSVHWSIGLGYAMIIPILGGTTFLISRRIKDIQSAIVRQTAELAGSTTETLRNVELVKSLGLEEQETLRLNDVNEKILALELRKTVMVRKLSFLQGTFINFLRSALLFLMIWLTFTQAVTLGEFFSLWFYSFFLFNPLSEFGTVFTSYQESRASMNALEEVLKIKPEEKPVNPATIGTLTDVEFKNVSFGYAGQESVPAAHDISVHLKSGETIAFVGPSGSGKTTLVKLLVGLYRPTGGMFLINGENSLNVDFDVFRRRIGYVSQETQLFAGTIRENLLFVSPTASDKECLVALRHAAALPIVERGGQGLDTKIGEGGIKISGGERQRLAIARALLRNPDLIIFDEATSSLDSLTEKAITDTIREIAGARPTLMMVLITHRLSTASHADTLYVLEKGKVVEHGRHGELLKKHGLYSALWREQSGGE